jgi:tetratricopeptide (TPR) repeat protein
MLPIDPQDLIKLAVDIFIDQIEKRGPALVKRMQEGIKGRRKTQKHVPRVQLVNRESEQRAIQSALNSPGSLRLLYFFGQGGAGKTRLLQAAEQYIKFDGKSSPLLRWGGLHDFYHTELHSVTTLQQAIVNGLDPMDAHFQEYRKSLARFNRLIAEGLVGSTLETERQALDDLFLEEYKAFARQYRPVLAFDTLESLMHESDWVESLCKLEGVPIASREWILQQVGSLENSVILMAGRPEPVFRKDLELANNSRPGRLEAIEINGLTREDTRQFLAMLLKEAPAFLKPLIEKSDQFWQVTRGLPVQLALAVDLASRAQFLVGDDGVNRAQSAEAFGQSLVGELFSGENPEARILFLLGLARKGMTDELLHYLEPDQSVSSCSRRLEQLRNTSIVKTRLERNELFLHDALYELFDAYFPSLPDLGPWYERLADYYRSKHSRSRRDITSDSQIPINLLYYELQLNPRHAFDAVYLPLREKALKGHELELDIHLRDELLRFIRDPAIARLKFRRHALTKADVDRDSAIRWIKRYLIQSNYQKAILIAETIITLGPKSLKALPPYSFNKNQTTLSQEQRDRAREILSIADPLFWGQVLTYYSEGLIYSGASESLAFEILKQASSILRKISISSHDPLKWLYERVVGRANDRLGYLYRSTGHYGSAINAYQKALPEFKREDIEDEEAATLNNLAFTFALLGAFRRAMDRVNRALELREGLGQKYPLALSHNTRGLIYTLQGQYEQGRKESQLALNMFVELETPRGVGLAYNALGYILRKQGQGWEAGVCSRPQAIQYFQQSARYFKQAEEIFSKQITEPIRLWEAYNEQGTLYREWGVLLGKSGDVDGANGLYSQAVEYQMKALETARGHGMHFQEADTLDDLAKVSYDLGETKKAKRLLGQARSMVPKEYSLSPDKKGREKPPSGEAYWLILGKIHLREGTWAIQESVNRRTISDRKRRELTQSAINNFTLAAHYFEKFWPRTSANRMRYQQMADQLLGLSIPTRVIKRAIKHESIQHKLNASEFIKMFPARPVGHGVGSVS